MVKILLIIIGLVRNGPVPSCVLAQPPTNTPTPVREQFRGTTTTMAAAVPPTPAPPCPQRRNNAGTMTYTLVQALDLSASRKRPHASTVLNGAGSNAPIDILVVILSLSTDLHAGRGPAAELLVTDQSLPLGCCCRIRLYGRENIKLLSEVGRGDVVRFNRVDVSKDNRNDANMHAECTSNDAPTRGTSRSTATGTAALSTVVCEMRPSWSDPEAGVPFARVGIGASACRSHGNEIVDGNDASPGEVVEPHVFPNSMITPPSAIEELLRWFQQQFCANVSSGEGSISYATAGVGPCRRRRLRDITNPNLLSEVVVNVTHCDASAILSPAAIMSLGGSAGMRRGKAASVSQQRAYVATLSDGHDASDMMPLYDCQRFKANLESSLSSDSRQRGRLLITNVLSRRLANYSESSFASCSSSMILLPTPDTTVVSFAADSSATCTSAAAASGCANVQSAPKASRKSTLTAQFWDSQSQLMTSSPGQDLKSQLGRGMSEEYETKIATSQILDIFIDDCNQCLSDEKVLADPDKLASILVGDCNDTESMFQYRNATITIDFNSAGKESFVVKASGNIMETLCCGCPAADLMEGKDDMAVVRSNARDILRGFIYLDVPLEWTLQKRKESETTGRWTVVDVALVNMSNVKKGIYNRTVACSSRRRALPQLDRLILALPCLALPLPCLSLALALALCLFTCRDPEVKTVRTRTFEHARPATFQPSNFQRRNTSCVVSSQ